MGIFENIKNTGTSTFLKAKKFSGENSPELFLAAGVLTFGISEIMAIKATRDSMMQLADIKKKECFETGVVPEMTRRRVVKATWKNFVGPIATFAIGSGLVVCGAKEYSNRTAALATALGVSQGMLNDYKKKTIEALGVDGERQKVTEEIAKEKIKNLKSEEDVTNTGKGDVLFYDACTGHLFRASKNSIREAVNAINERLFDEMNIEFSELCWEIGYDGGYLAETNGWNIADGRVVVKLDEASVTEDGIPFVIMDFLVKPSGDYRNR